MQDKSVLKLIMILYIFMQSVTTVWGGGYSLSPKFTTSGGGTWGSILKMTAVLDGSMVTFAVKKRSGNFAANCHVYLKIGSYLDTEQTRDCGIIPAGGCQWSQTHHLDLYSGYPKDFYFRLVPANGGYAWVGPITINYTEPIPSVPSSPRVTIKNTGEISIIWKSVRGATQYKLYKASSASGKYKRIYWGSSQTYSDEVSLKKTEMTYFYKVSAGNASGWSNLSDDTPIKITVSTKKPTPKHGAPSRVDN